MTPPLVIGLDDTWDTKGRYGPVRFFPAMCWLCFFASIKICFYQSGMKPNIEVIFWGTWRGILAFYKKAYEDDGLLF